MATYNYELAKKTVQKYSDLLQDASLGMLEDWCWTAEVIYEDGMFTLELEKEPLIGGINGSSWATPTLELIFKNGETRVLDCYEGMVNPSEKPDWFKLEKEIADGLLEYKGE